MADPQDEVLARAELYAGKHGLALWERLGHGLDGIIWATSRTSAIKVFYRSAAYQREVQSYQRLAERGVCAIEGHAIPRIVGHDDGLMVLEITLVQRPFILDFAAAYVDRPSGYPADVVAESLRSKAELFGSKWPTVVRILAQLRALGIEYMDPSPGNIRFSDELE